MLPCFGYRIDDDFGHVGIVAGTHGCSRNEMEKWRCRESSIFVCHARLSRHASDSRTILLPLISGSSLIKMLYCRTSLMKTKAVHTRLFQEKESLEQFIYEHISRLKDGSVLVVTSKIVALSEGRTAAPEDKVKIIKRESEWAVPTKYVWLTIKDGMFMAAAGIDESNARGKLILLPKDSFRAAARLRTTLLKHYKIKRLGVLITDSRVLPLRVGVVGVALGYAGFSGVKDYRGSSDLFGRKLKITRVDVADSLATSAVLLMGEGNERKPLAIIENAPVEFRDHVNSQELIIPVADDLYVPFLGKLNFKKRKTKN